MLRWRKRRTVDKIIRENFWEGFQYGLSEQAIGGLEYSSTSGWYQYNGIRRIAERAGYDLAQRVLTEYDLRRGGQTVARFGSPFRYRIPAHVFRECYDEVGLFATRAEVGGNGAP